MKVSSIYFFLLGLTLGALLMPCPLRAVDPGQIDDSFNSPNGYALFDRVAPAAASAKDVAVQSDGKILVVGSVLADRVGADADLLVLRYNSDGSLDDGFGSHGAVTWDSGKDDTGYAVALQGDGKIIVLSEWYDSAGPYYAVRVLRFTDTGALDATFGSSGVFSHQSYSYTDPRSLAVGPADAVYVCGTVYRTTFDFFVIKLSASGALDSGFGTGGEVLFGDSSEEYATGLSVDASGKVAVAGSRAGNILVLKLKADGSPDEAFDSDGCVVWGGSYTDYGTAVAIQSDEKVVVAGIYGYFTGTGNGQDGVIVRFNSDGSLDTNFSNDATPGYDRININGDDYWDWAWDIALLGGGLIQVAGEMATADDDHDLFTVRYDGDGNRVAGFDGDGVAVWDDAGHRSNGGMSLAAVSGGKVAIAGYTYNATPDLDFLAVVYRSDGALETGFDLDGAAIYNGYASTTDENRAVAIQSDGKILVGGFSAGLGGMVARYTAAGALDASFGSGGVAALAQISEVNALAIEPDGDIVAVGDYAGDVAVARLTSLGALDTTFSGDGYAGYTSGGTVDHGYAVAVDEGLVVVAGTKGDKLLLLRFTAAGAPDGGFGAGGVFEWLAPGSLSDVAYAVAVQSDNRIVVAGYDENAGATLDLLLARVEADGSALDTTFDGDGYFTYDRGNDGNYFDEAFGLALLGDGKILAAGYHEHYYNLQTDADLVLLRLTSGGALDGEFGSGGVAEYGDSTNDDYGRSLVLQENGKILVAGYTTYNNNEDALVARFLANGSLDTGFGTGGAFLFTGTAGQDARAAAIALQSSDGKAVAAGLNFSGAKPLDDGLTLRLETSRKYLLTVTKAGSGAAGGSVAADVEPELSWVGNQGSAQYEESTALVLTASAGSGTRFDGWTDCPAPSDETCAVTMSEAKAITATFTAIHALTVNKSGTGSGSVTASTGTLEWSGSVGTEEYDEGTPVTLTALAGASSNFSGWSGDCDSVIANQCMLTMDAAKTASASFSLKRYRLTVTKSGSGSGTVTAAPGGLTWSGNSATATYDHGTPVTLTASPSDTGSAFTGWSNCPSPNGVACQATLTADLSIGARFLVNRPKIEITPAAHAFGDVKAGASSSAKTLTVANRGAQDLTLDSWQLAGKETAHFSLSAAGGAPCSFPLILAADAGCTMRAVFAPLAAGLKEAKAVFFSDDHASCAAMASLSGTGILASYPKVTLLAPDGGEYLPAGESFKVRWACPVADARFRLSYSIDKGVTWKSIAKNLSGNSFYWSPPAFIRNKSKCLLKVIAVKDGARIGADRSDAFFAIGVVRLVMPNGGERLNGGETYAVAWNVHATVRPVQRMLLQATLDGLSWSTQADFKTGPYPAGNYSFNWPAANVDTPSLSARLRILLKDTGGKSIGSDRGDKVFAIDP